MKKLFTSILIIVLSLEVVCYPALAFGRNKHDYYTEYVLFGEFHSNALNSEQQKAIELLDCALYLAIDQFNGNGQTELTTLKDAGITGLPELDEINYTGSSNTHRSFTHRGWDFNYQIDKANWLVRKEILHATAKEIFPEFVNEQQCDAFCALIYYIHIVADGKADKSYKKDDLQIQVGGKSGRDNNDAIQEILRVLPLVFPSQKETNTYRGLITGLQSLDSKMTKLSVSTGGINTEEKFTEYHGYVEETMEILHARIYRLLQKEPFFRSVFPLM